MKGVYEELKEEVSDLNKKEFTKASLMAISHGIEDFILQEKVRGDFFVTFQKFDFFLAEKDRYLKLEKVCRNLFIFLTDIKQNEIKEFKEAVFIEISPEEPLANEWDLVFKSENHTLALLTREKEKLQKFSGDNYRIFSGHFSMTPSIVDKAINKFYKRLKLEGFNLKFNSREKESKEKNCYKFNSQFSAILNRSIEEIEDMALKLTKKNSLLEELIQESEYRTLEMVQRLCFAAEHRDEETALHLIRMSYYSTVLYREIDDDYTKVKNMRYASLMHDIGKVGIPDSILLKPGPLTEKEFKVIKKHPVIGADILKDSSHELIQMAKDIAHYHHEKWNGSGYPEGLSGEDIPLVARVVAVADVFDALTSKRTYKDAYPVEKAVKIIKKGSGNDFDPRIVELFLENIDTMINFRRSLNNELVDKSEKEVADIYFSKMLND